MAESLLKPAGDMIVSDRQEFKSKKLIFRLSGFLLDT